MRLEFSEGDVGLLAKAIALEVAKELKPALKPQGQDGDKIFTVESLAEYLGVGKSWVYGNMRQIPHFKVGRFPRFRKRQIDKWLEQHKAPIFNHLQRKFISR